MPIKSNQEYKKKKVQISAYISIFFIIALDLSYEEFWVRAVRDVSVCAQAQADSSMYMYEYRAVLFFLCLLEAVDE